jgi:hypothetical protein
MTLMNTLFPQALLRSWLIFVIVSLIAGVAMLIADGDHPLESDDPYLVGFLISGIAAAIMFVSSLSGGPANRTANLWFFGILAAWFVALVVAEALNDGEGDGLMAMMAVASLIMGTAGWYLVGLVAKIHYPRNAVIILSCLGITIISLYGFVYYKHAQRRQEMMLHQVAEPRSISDTA